MNTESELPPEVIAELEAGRKVAAIKKLRAIRGAELVEAKRLVDDYLQEHPDGSRLKPPRTETGIGRIILLVIGVGIIFAIYRHFG